MRESIGVFLNDRRWEREGKRDAEADKVTEGEGR
jgi:hypothetical protein